MWNTWVEQSFLCIESVQFCFVFIVTQRFVNLTIAYNHRLTASVIDESFAEVSYENKQTILFHFIDAVVIANFEEPWECESHQHDDENNPDPCDVAESIIDAWNSEALTMEDSSGLTCSCIFSLREIGLLHHFPHFQLASLLKFGDVFPKSTFYLLDKIEQLRWHYQTLTEIQIKNSMLSQFEFNQCQWLLRSMRKFIHEWIPFNFRLFSLIYCDWYTYSLIRVSRGAEEIF